MRQLVRQDGYVLIVFRLRFRHCFCWSKFNAEFLFNCLYKSVACKCFKPTANSVLREACTSAVLTTIVNIVSLSCFCLNVRYSITGESCCPFIINPYNKHSVLGYFCPKVKFSLHVRLLLWGVLYFPLLVCTWRDGGHICGVLGLRTKVVSKTKHSKTKIEVRSTQISKTKHQKLETTVGWRTRTLISLARRKPYQVEATNASAPPKDHKSIPRFYVKPANRWTERF